MSTIAHQRISGWLWLSAVDLDAPIVAVVWQRWLCRSFGLELPWAARVTLGLTVWAIYLGDRLWDARGTCAGNETVAHRLCRDHRLAMMVLLSAVGCVDCLVGFLWAPQQVLLRGVIVAAAVGSWLILTPGYRYGTHTKNVGTAALFAVGVFVVAPFGLSEIVPALTFGLLCFANLTLLTRWHRGLGTEREGWLVVASAIVVIALGGSGWYTITGIAGLGLGLLAVVGDRVAWDTRRVLADLVLLAPVLTRVHNFR